MQSKSDSGQQGSFEGLQRGHRSSGETSEGAIAERVMAGTQENGWRKSNGILLECKNHIFHVTQKARNNKGTQNNRHPACVCRKYDACDADVGRDR